MTTRASRRFTRALDIDGPAGRLEAVLMTPSEMPSGAAVLCHAHPLQGGMMHFKLLFRVAKVFQERGYGVLRFNFRGVGRSEGVHDHGHGEQDDVRAAVGVLEREFPGVPIVAGGFSFGSVMALRAGAADARVSGLLALGLPVGVMPDTKGLGRSTKPRLFVQGEKDEFGNGEAIRRFFERLSEPKALVVVPESDHFFTGAHDAVERAVSSWAAERLVR